MLQNWGYKKVLAGSNWQSCGMQVRVEGSVEKVPEEESEKYFHSRPRGSQLGAIVSKQVGTLLVRDWKLKLNCCHVFYSKDEMEVDLPRRKIKLTILFNRVLSLLEGRSFNRCTRNWSTNILMGEFNVSMASIFIIHCTFFCFFLSFCFSCHENSIFAALFARNSFVAATKLLYYFQI